MKTKEEVNKYYELVNKYIDSYLSEWNIKPSRLKKYLSKTKVNSFLEKNGLSDINMINVVLDNIIDDRVAMEKDMVLTFESFILESLEGDNTEIDVYDNIPNAGINHEKMLADAFDTSLSKVTIVNPSKHIFEVDGMVSDSTCIIFTGEEMDSISENMKRMVVSSIKTSRVKVQKFGLELNVSEFMDVQKLEDYSEKFLTNEKVTKVLKDMLRCYDVKKSDNGFIGIIDPGHR
jgi:hypothetical protein